MLSSLSRRRFAERSLRPDQPVLFMHVPKTAGTSMNAAIAAALQAPPSARMDRALFGSFAAFDSMSDAVRQSIAMSPADYDPDARFVTGHATLHTLRQAYPRGNLFTLLREPRVRLLSLWLFWRGQPEEGAGAWGGWFDHAIRRARLPLESFLGSADLAGATDNVYARTVLWPDPLVPVTTFLPAEDAARLGRRALAAYTALDHVDVIENPAHVARLGRWLGRDVEARRDNVTAPLQAGLCTTLLAELTPAALDLLDARTALDRQIWSALVRERLPEVEPAVLAERVFALSIARYAELLRPEA